VGSRSSHSADASTSDGRQVSWDSLTASRAGRRRAWSLVAVGAALAAVTFAGAARPGPEPRSSAPSSEAAATEALTLPRSVPVRLRIPAIGVDSDLMDLGLQRDGTLEVPPGAFPAGWFEGAPTPGELGPAIIVGHVRFTTPGVFARLTDLRRNDEIDVARRDGSTAAFRVTQVQHFDKAEFPTEQVYGNIDHAGLRLITCGGLDADTNTFDENVVVYAELRDS